MCVLCWVCVSHHYSRDLDKGLLACWQASKARPPPLAAAATAATCLRLRQHLQLVTLLFVCLVCVPKCVPCVYSGAGAASLYVPRYIAEVSPPSLRGWLGSLNQVWGLGVGFWGAWSAGCRVQSGGLSVVLIYIYIQNICITLLACCCVVAVLPLPSSSSS